MSRGAWPEVEPGTSASGQVVDARPTPATLWLVFVALSIAWGASFLFVKIGLDAGLPPLVLVMYQLWCSVLFVVVVARITGARLRLGRGTFLTLAPLGVINVAIPFVLVAWGEQYVPSGLASILNSLVPVFTIVIAAIVLRDEPISLRRVAGVTLGLGGAAVLVSPSLLGSETHPPGGSDPQMALLGEVAIMLSCLGYACGTVYARARISGRPLVGTGMQARPLRPVETAFGQNIVAAPLITIAAILTQLSTGTFIVPPATPSAWLAVVWLGAIVSGVGYLLFFRLVTYWTATRTALVTYAIPVVGVVLGIVVLDEVLDARELIGCALIIAGIALASSGGAEEVPSPRPSAT